MFIRYDTITLRPHFRELNIIIDLILLFIIYSVILSSIVDHYSKKFININLEED